MPNHFSLPLVAAELLAAGADEVVLETVDVFSVVDVVVDVALVVVDVLAVVVVGAAAPGRHWLYQSFWYTQV
jgi:hypothetical protein